MADLEFELGDGKKMPGIGIGTFQMSGAEVEASVVAALKV